MLMKTETKSYFFYHIDINSEEEMKNSEIPDFPHLVNFPAHLHRYRTLSEVEKDRRRCVMCGETRLCSSSNANQSREAFSRSKQKMAQNRGLHSDELNDSVHIIPKQNKGLCTACDVAVWIIKESGVEIKWCKGCKNFRPWAAFGDKGLATKCLRCRDRQREKYATQKEEKFKKNTPKAASVKKEKKSIEKTSNNDEKSSTKDSGKDDKTATFSSPHSHGMSCLIAATTQVTSEE
jgi:ferredoxin-like protein FixX